MQGVDSSPAQRLMGRRPRTLLLTTKSLLEPRNPLNSYEMQQLHLNQRRQAKHYNRTAHDLPTWSESLRTLSVWNLFLTCRLDERSYEVQASGTIYRRNRQHLVRTPQLSNQLDPAAEKPHLYQTLVATLHPWHQTCGIMPVHRATSQWRGVPRPLRKPSVTQE